MKTVQEIFDIAIETGLYNIENTNVFMCISIKYASIKGFITHEEYLLARLEIINYLSGFGSLGGLLKHSGKPHSFEDRLKIYQNWKNRPKIKEVD